MDTNADLRADSPLMTMSNSFLGDGILSLSIPGPSRDPTYYISDGNTVLLVENTLFKVSSRFFGLLVLSRHSECSCVSRSISIGASVHLDERQVGIRYDVPAILGG